MVGKGNCDGSVDGRGLEGLSEKKRSICVLSHMIRPWPSRAAVSAAVWILNSPW